MDTATVIEMEFKVATMPGGIGVNERFAFPKESRSVDNDLIWSASLVYFFECVDNRRIWLTSSWELALFPDAVIPLQSVRERSPTK